MWETSEKRPQPLGRSLLIQGLISGQTCLCPGYVVEINVTSWKKTKSCLEKISMCRERCQGKTDQGWLSRKNQFVQRILSGNNQYDRKVVRIKSVSPAIGVREMLLCCRKVVREKFAFPGKVVRRDGKCIEGCNGKILNIYG